MIKNLPALPVRAQLNSLANALDLDWIDANGKALPNANAIMNLSSDLKGYAISQYFDGRYVSAQCGRDFWVFTNTWADVQVIKEKARAYGFKRLTTIVPKAADPQDETKTIVDPQGNFAVQVRGSDSLIFGDLGKKWLEAHSHLIDVVKEHIIFTYCYNTDSRFTFESKEAAAVLHAGLLTHYAHIEAEAKIQRKSMPPMIIKMKKTDLDNWTVYLDFDREAMKAAA